MDLLTENVPKSRLGRPLARFWVVLGDSWASLGQLLGALGRLLAPLGHFLGALGHLLAGLWRSLATFWRPEAARASIFEGFWTCQAGFWTACGVCFACFLLRLALRYIMILLKQYLRFCFYSRCAFFPSGAAVCAQHME